MEASFLPALIQDNILLTSVHQVADTGIEHLLHAKQCLGVSEETVPNGKMKTT